MAAPSGGVGTPREVLARTPFFAGVLDARGLDALAARLRIADYAKGAALIREDALGSSMFVLASGEVAVTVPGRSGARRVATLRPPDVFGEMSLLTGARRAATVTARTPVKAIEIEKAALAPLIAATPALADRFAEMLHKRQAQLDRIYRGEGRWRFGDKDLASAIRGFFGGAV